jgi:hypothetical protein
MEIAEAVQICRLQEFWNQVITEYTTSRSSPRRQQELWVILRSKLMVELRNLGEPIPKILIRFQHLTKDLPHLKRKKFSLSIPVKARAHLQGTAEKKLEALTIIYNSFTKISEGT